MTSRMSSDTAMLIERRPSNRKGDTGRIINRMVPSSPKVRNRSPLRNKRARLDVGLATVAVMRGSNQNETGAKRGGLRRQLGKYFPAAAMTNALTLSASTVQ